MILKEPYSSKSLKLYNTSHNVAEVNRYITIDYAYIKTKEKLKIKPFTDGRVTINPVVLYGLSDTEKGIVPLNHPLFSPSNNWTTLDLRNYVKVSGDGTSYEIRNESEYHLAIARFILTSLWYVGNQTSLYSLELAHFAFSSWLSDNLASKFGLDLGDKLKLKVLANIYYARMFTEYPDSEELDKLLIRAKNDGLIPDLYREIYSQVSEPDSLNSIDDFCKQCYKVTGNVRLKDLDYLVLINIIQVNWMGANGKELICLALEHPPTWIAMVYAAITQRTFKRNYVTTVVERHSKRGNGDAFVKSLQGKIDDCIEA